jgi:hypothetical protein
VIVTVNEEQAKAVWLAKLDVPALNVKSEAAAKATWLASLDTPEWGKGKVVPTEMAPKAEPVFALAASSENAEAVAKAAWIAKLDQ